MVGGGGEQRTLRIAAKHADMTHWFPLGLDVLRHKSEVLAGYCEEIGRDPASIALTMASPVLLVADEREGAALLDRLPPERRASVSAVPPAQAADVLRPYLDAGFVGFTFNNPVLPTPDAIGLAGELLAML
jgi:alkanesulfonate monooxygenase SsuD/methylene tetrahydromethanopterin reductase-like flavin-dependent oxidoreductase (luciferase family)